MSKCLTLETGPVLTFKEKGGYVRVSQPESETVGKEDPKIAHIIFFKIWMESR